MSTPTVDIFIKSHQPDFKFLKYCLLSIIKHATNYNRIILVVPNGSLQAMIDADITIPDRTSIESLKEEGNDGYIWQQYTKLIAHEYSDADYIMYVDSDCVCTHPIDVSKLVENDKPTMLYTPYKDIQTPWQAPTEALFERPVEYEFMRRSFLIYHRSTVKNFCAWMEQKFQTPLKQWCIAQGTMSEFNFLGAYAWFYEHEKYNWINTTTEAFPPETGAQYWSHGNPNGDEMHRREYQRSLDTINKALNLNISEL